jgi:EmrB/QacA subfamily drug resistance transporter
VSDDGSEKVRKWWAFAGLGTLSFLGCIDLTIVSTAAPVIQDDLGATVTELQLIVNVFVVALSTGMVTMGRLADSHGRRKVLYTGAAVFCAASLGAGFAAVPEWLIAFRFLQGAACAVLYTATGALVTAIFPPHERGKAIGCLYGVNGLGLASGPVLGGFLVGSASWSWVFWMNVPLVAVALAVCLPTVPESYGEKMTGGMDWPGLALLSLSVPALVLALTLGHVWGWSSPATVALLVCGGAALAAFRAVELRAQNPLIRFQLFAGRDFLGAVTADFALAFFYCVVLFLMPLYLHTVRGLDGHTTGLLLLPCTAAVAVLSPFVGRLVDRHGPRRMLCLGFLALAGHRHALPRVGARGDGGGLGPGAGARHRRRPVRRAGPPGRDGRRRLVDLPQPGGRAGPGRRHGGLPALGAGRPRRPPGRARPRLRPLGEAGGGEPAGRPGPAPAPHGPHRGTGR